MMGWEKFNLSKIKAGDRVCLSFKDEIPSNDILTDDEGCSPYHVIRYEGILCYDLNLTNGFGVYAIEDLGSAANWMRVFREEECQNLKQY